MKEATAKLGYRWDPCCFRTLPSPFAKKSEDENGFIVRRYTLKAISPCEFERDATLPELESGTLIAADDAGDMLTGIAGAITLIKNGGQRIVCTGKLPSDVDATSIVLARDGTVAYVGHYGYDAGAVVNASISKVTITGDSCVLAPFRTTGTALTGIEGLALDSKGRLHVADNANIPPGAKRVAIYAPDGAFVSAYDSAGDGSYFSPAGITACRGGICVDGFGSVVSFDENGVVRANADLEPLESLSGVIRYLGTPRGPFLLVGGSYDEPRRIIANAMKQP